MDPLHPKESKGPKTPVLEGRDGQMLGGGWKGVAGMEIRAPEVEDGRQHRQARLWGSCEGGVDVRLSGVGDWRVEQL